MMTASLARHIALNKRVAPIVVQAFHDEMMSVPREWATVPPPACLHHFTSAEGFLGIVEHHRIRATLSTCSNDVSESSYAESIALEVAKKGVEDVPRELTQRIVKLLRSGSEKTLGAARVRVFTASFSDAVDDSSQWLNYGRKGTGLALAFGAERLSGRDFLLMPVSYERDEQQQLIRQVIQRIARFMLPDKPYPEEEESLYRVNAQLITLGIRVISPAIKSPAFASEREWRLVTYELNVPGNRNRRRRCQYRTHDGRIVAFVERVFPLRSLPIVGIELGHSCPMFESDPTFSMLGLGGLPVRRSTVTVR